MSEDRTWKIRFYKTGEWTGIYGIVCPGCDAVHQIDGKWEFNGDMKRPTFSPSLLVTRSDGIRCHSFIRDGKIEFLSDCTHELAGQTVDLPPARSSFGAS